MANKAAQRKLAREDFVGMSDADFVAAIGQQLGARPKLAKARAQVVECLNDALSVTSEGVTETDLERFVNGLDAVHDSTLDSKQEATAGARTKERVVVKAREAIFEEEMLTASELQDLLTPGGIKRASSSGTRERATRERPGASIVRTLERSGALLALHRDRSKCYPAFQIDREHRRVHPEVREVNQILGAGKDPWGAASWWISPNARIGAAPMSLLGTSKSPQLVALAKSLLDDGY